MQCFRLSVRNVLPSSPVLLLPISSANAPQLHLVGPTLFKLILVHKTFLLWGQFDSWFGERQEINFIEGYVNWFKSRVFIQVYS
jgi:hypothetical protein